MAFKINILDRIGSAQDRVEALIQKVSNKTDLLRLVKKAVSPSELAYLAESIALARPSLAGELIFDHVTFSINTPDQQASNVNISNKVFKTASDFTIDSLNYMLGSSYRREDILKIYNLFKDTGSLSITLDYVYISVDYTNNILRQSIKGVKGTQKTVLSQDDYVINFTGKTIGANSLTYDVSTVKKLKALVEMGISLKVDSVYLNRIFDIYTIVLENVSHTQSAEPGQGNMLDFSITAYSDAPLNIIHGTNIKI